MSIKPLRLLPLFVFPFLVLNVSANWLLVADFDDVALDDLYYVKRFAPQGEFFLRGDGSGLEDPFDPSNGFLVVDPGPPVQGLNNNVTVAIPLPEPLPNGEVGTLRYRIFLFGNASLNNNIGASAVPVQIDPDRSLDTGRLSTPGPGQYGAFESQLGVTGANFALRSGNTFQQTPIAIPVNEWVTIFHVIDNGNDTTEFYFRTDSMAEPQPIPSFAGTTSFPFRNGTDDPLVTFMMVYAGQGDTLVDFMMIDEILWDPTGVNLEDGPIIVPDPVEPGILRLWAGFPVDANWNVDTGGFMGELYVEHAPWIYSYRMEEYMYIPEELITTGNQGAAWAYVMD